MSNEADVTVPTSEPDVSSRSSAPSVPRGSSTSGAALQLKAALVGHSYATQASMLSPIQRKRTSVQMDRPRENAGPEALSRDMVALALRMAGTSRNVRRVAYLRDEGLGQVGPALDEVAGILREFAAIEARRPPPTAAPPEGLLNAHALVTTQLRDIDASVGILRQLIGNYLRRSAGDIAATRTSVVALQEVVAQNQLVLRLNMPGLDGSLRAILEQLATMPPEGEAATAPAEQTQAGGGGDRGARDPLSRDMVQLALRMAGTSRNVRRVAYLRDDGLAQVPPVVDEVGGVLRDFAAIEARRPPPTAAPPEGLLNAHAQITTQLRDIDASFGILRQLLGSYLRLTAGDIAATRTSVNALQEVVAQNQLVLRLNTPGLDASLRAMLETLASMQATPAAP